MFASRTKFSGLESKGNKVESAILQEECKCGHFMPQKAINFHYKQAKEAQVSETLFLTCVLVEPVLVVDVTSKGGKNCHTSVCAGKYWNHHFMCLSS